ncbi:MAG: sigma-70 family RNA polymerase sigma factor [Planctomycetes bacterium]|nr:sigma-70 family RNA polymerase sigma factor [Planctomycetota bacterium]
MEQDSDPKTLLEMVEAVRGDTAQLGKVLERYRVRLIPVVIATGVYRGAEDVVQEALLKIVQAVNDRKLQLLSGPQFRSWAHNIARNCAIDALRRERRQPRRLESLFGDERWSGAIAGPDATPSGALQAKEGMAELQRREAERFERIAGLRKLDQALVWMREHDGMTFVAIAERMSQDLGVTVQADALRMKYRRLVETHLGPPLSGPIDG